MYTQTLKDKDARNAVNNFSRILRMHELQSRLGLSRHTIYQLIKSDDFPPSIPLGQRSVGWLESDIDQWIEGRIKSRRPDVK